MKLSMTACGIGLLGAIYAKQLRSDPPLQDRVAGELAAIVADDRLRLAAYLDYLLRLTSNPKLERVVSATSARRSQV